MVYVSCFSHAAGELCKKIENEYLDRYIVTARGGAPVYKRSSGIGGVVEILPINTIFDTVEVKNGFVSIAAPTLFGLPRGTFWIPLKDEVQGTILKNKPFDSNDVKEDLKVLEILPLIGYRGNEVGCDSCKKKLDGSKDEFYHCNHCHFSKSGGYDLCKQCYQGNGRAHHDQMTGTEGHDFIHAKDGKLVAEQAIQEMLEDSDDAEDKDDEEEEQDTIGSLDSSDEVFEMLSEGRNSNDSRIDVILFQKKHTATCLKVYSDFEKLSKKTLKNEKHLFHFWQHDFNLFDSEAFKKHDVSQVPCILFFVLGKTVENLRIVGDKPAALARSIEAVRSAALTEKRTDASQIKGRRGSGILGRNKNQIQPLFQVSQRFNHGNSSPRFIFENDNDTEMDEIMDILFKQNLFRR